MCTMNFRQGLRHGVCRTYYAGSNLLESSMVYANGHLNGVYKKLHRNRQMAELGRYIAGKRVGKVEQWFRSGMPKCSMIFLDNMMNGVQRTFYRRGGIRLHITYVNAQRHGIAQQWYSNGSLSRTGEYRDDKATGWHFQYDKQGRVIIGQFTCDDVCLYGWSMDFDENGMPHLTCTKLSDDERCG